MFNCEHAICDICIKIFSESVKRNDYCFQFIQCILCISQESLQVCVKPSTAKFHIFSINEESVCRMMLLKFLSLFQNMLNLTLQMQNLFNQAFETSFSNLIIIELFLKNWDIYYCIQMFNEFLWSFFKVHLIKDQRFITHMYDYFHCWFRDGHYNMAVLKNYFKNIFRLDFCMFNVIFQHISDCKVAVIAITIFNASVYVFSNYNRCEWRKKESEYKYVHPVHIKNELFI